MILYIPNVAVSIWSVCLSVYMYVCMMMMSYILIILHHVGRSLNRE
jgi:hypothetical protein